MTKNDQTTKAIEQIRKTGHSLKSRRDFLAHGFVPYAAWAAMPGFMGLAARKAYAECGGGARPTMVPFLGFDMAGGAALPGNFLVGGPGGPEDLLTSYNFLGWDPRENGGLDTSFGLPMAATYSTMLAGILANTTPEARANLRMGSICHFAQDDSASNQLNVATLATNAGQRGLYIGNGLGQRRTNSGGNSRSVLEDVALKPAAVNSVDDVIKSASFGGESFRSLNQDQIKTLARRAYDLSKVQAEPLIGLPGGRELGELADCAFQKSVELAEGVSGLDPRLDGNCQNIYGIEQNTASGDELAVSAALAMNSILGNSGPSVFTLGGCDYHTGEFVTGDAKDREMGDQIGRAIQLAHLNQRPLFFQLFTDGGCDSVSGSRAWRGDSGDKCMTVIGYYRPAGPPSYRNGKIQVGHYTNGQAASRDTLVGSNPRLAGYAVFANYLAINGQLGKFHQYAPGIFTGAGELESVLIFEEA